MPAVRHYEVEQTRCVSVAASNITEALLIANREFAKASPEEDVIPNEEVQGYVVRHALITHVDIRKEF